MTTTGTLAFTSTHGMIDGIHGNTTDMRTFAHPAGAACLAQFLALMLTISHLTDAGATELVKLAYLA